jgi:hypothetical protein
MDEDQTRLLRRIDTLISHAQDVLGKATDAKVPAGEFVGWRARVATFLQQESGDQGMYTQEFLSHVRQGYVNEVEAGIGILRAVRADVESGDFESIRPSFTIA